MARLSWLGWLVACRDSLPISLIRKTGSRITDFLILDPGIENSMPLRRHDLVYAICAWHKHDTALVGAVQARTAYSLSHFSSVVSSRYVACRLERIVALVWPGVWPCVGLGACRGLCCCCYVLGDASSCAARPPVCPSTPLFLPLCLSLAQRRIQQGGGRLLPNFSFECKFAQ